MRSFFIQRNSFLLLLAGLVVVSASLVYLFAAGNAFIGVRHFSPPKSRLDP